MTFDSPQHDALRAYLCDKIELTADEYAFTASLFVPKSIKKHGVLLHAGDVRDSNAFIAAGCMRLYATDAGGGEHVVQFAIENWWIADFYSMLTGEPATYTIDALEDSELLLLGGPARERLCRTVPKFERFFRLLLERNYVATQRRIHASLSMSMEQQYLALQRAYPEIVLRVPQNQIASYLGVTPQSLSRIRREIARKH